MPEPKQPGLNPTAQIRANAEVRRYQTLELFKGGATEKQIAETLGVSKGLVHRDIKRVLSDLAKMASRTADSVRAMQMERYTSLLSRWWLRAMNGDAEATRMVLSIMARIDVVNGIIPDKPMIDMRTQTIQVGDGLGLMELAKVIANGSGEFGTNGFSPPDTGESDTVSEGGSGG